VFTVTEMSRERFLAEVARNGSVEEEAVMVRILDWVDAHGMRDYWQAKASVHGEGYAPAVKGIEWEPIPFGIGSDPPRLFVSGENLRRHHPYKIEAKWQAVLEELYSIPGVVRTELGFYPNIRLRQLADDEAWIRVFSVIEGIVDSVRRSAALGITLADQKPEEAGSPGSHLGLAGLQRETSHDRSMIARRMLRDRERVATGEALRKSPGREQVIILERDLGIPWISLRPRVRTFGPQSTRALLKASARRLPRQECALEAVDQPVGLDPG
jgi:hypothetical protein